MWDTTDVIKLFTPWTPVIIFQIHRTGGTKEIKLALNVTLNLTGLQSRWKVSCCYVLFGEGYTKRIWSLKQDPKARASITRVKKNYFAELSLYVKNVGRVHFPLLGMWKQFILELLKFIIISWINSSTTICGNTYLLSCLRYKVANTIHTTANRTAATNVKQARIGDIDTFSPFDWPGNVIHLYTFIQIKWKLKSLYCIM